MADGGGRVLDGSKIWRYRYSLHGKQQRLVTIGEYPAVGLTAARVRARSYVEIVASGVSPVADARKDRVRSRLIARFVATQESRDRVLSPDEIGHVLRAVYAFSIRRPLKLAIHLLVLTMVRKSELIEATWDEFDLDAGIWRIPAGRMKKSGRSWARLWRVSIGFVLESRGHRALGPRLLQGAPE